VFRVFSCWLIAIFMSGCTDHKPTTAQTFDVDTWSRTPEKERHALALDLVNRQVLDGKRPTDVIAMLGAPSSRNEVDHYLTYIVSAGGGGFDQVQVLEIRFNSADDTVKGAIIRGD